jgi:hypothetical protein
MLNRIDVRAFFADSRPKLLSLCLVSALAATASGHPISPTGNPRPPADTDTGFIDPNGLEMDGAGAAESDFDFNTTDMTLLMIWIALTLGLVGGALAAERDRRRAEVSGDASPAMPRQDT